MSRGRTVQIIVIRAHRSKGKQIALESILLPLSFVKLVEINVAELVNDGDYGRMYAAWAVQILQTADAPVQTARQTRERFAE